jgi:hypothetical protein
MVPEAIQSFLHGGFDKDEAWAWATEEIFGYEAMFWRHAGYAPTEAAAIRRATEPTAQAVLWALTGLASADALGHATLGANPADFLRPPELEAPAPAQTEIGEWEDFYDYNWRTGLD